VDGGNLREYATNAIRYWEFRRLLYNLVLAGIVLIYFALNYPHSRSVISLDGILAVFLLAVLANVAFCAAYVVDLFAQASGLREVWLKYRWVLFAIGLAFAATLTRFFAMGMFSTAG
jgi:hypothetical protein